MVRVPPTELEPIDVLIKAQPKPRPSRPEAIRRLVELGLTVSSPKERSLVPPRGQIGLKAKK
jgi:hypothetical protein